MKAALRKAEMQVWGGSDCGNEAHALAALALVRAFGAEPAARLYIESPSLAGGRCIPDLLLCHPRIGALVVEVKAWNGAYIEQVRAGRFFLMGTPGEHNPQEQARRAMFQLKDGLKPYFDDESHLRRLLRWKVALPNLDERNWDREGFGESLARAEFLLADDLEDPQRLQERLLASCELPAGLLDAVDRLMGNASPLAKLRAARQAPPRTLGATIDEWESAPHQLTREQERLSLLPISGHPRLVRGVAGSGKSVVLARMAAQYLATERHRAHPGLFPDVSDPLRVGVVCFNKSLAPMLEKKIRTIYRALTREEVPEGVLRVIHVAGLLSNLEHRGLVQNRSSVPIFECAGEFAGQLAAMAAEGVEAYHAFLMDAVFVDEAQDLTAEDFRFLLHLLKTMGTEEEKNLVLFYDDAQNIYGRKRPVWKELGIDVQGGRSQVMKVCHRNTVEIVTLSFNLLLGAAAPPEVKAGTREFADLAFLKREELVTEENGSFQIAFASRSLGWPRLQRFSNRKEEFAHLLAQIEQLLVAEQVRPEDLLVLFHEKHTCEVFSRLLERKRAQGKLPVSGLVQPYGRHPKGSPIFQPGHLTVSTIHGAKGYDAPVVLFGALDAFSGLEDEKIRRARFYVGATRAKHFLHLSGLAGPDPFLDELEATLSMLVLS